MKAKLILTLLIIGQLLYGQNISIVKDLDTNYKYDYSGGISSFEVLNNKIITGLAIENFNNELYKTDGTDTGTYLIKDIYPGSINSSPDNFFKVGNKVYFTANQPPHGRELWITDGTDSGTHIVKDINLGYGDVEIEYKAVANGILFFTALNSTTQKRELWRTNGTAAGTIKLTSFSSYGGFEEFKAIGNTLYFVYNSGFLYKTTTTSNNSYNVTYNGTPWYNIHSLTEFNGDLYFIFNGDLKKTSVNSNTYSNVSAIYDFKSLCNHNGYLYTSVRYGIDVDELYRYNGLSLSLVDTLIEHAYRMYSCYNYLYLLCDEGAHVIYKTNGNPNNKSYVYEGSSGFKFLKRDRLYLKNTKGLYFIDSISQNVDTIFYNNIYYHKSVGPEIHTMNNEDYFLYKSNYTEKLYFLSKFDESSKQIIHIPFGSKTKSGIDDTPSPILSNEKLYFTSHDNSQSIGYNLWVSNSTDTGTFKLNNHGYRYTIGSLNNNFYYTSGFYPPIDIIQSNGESSNTNIIKSINTYSEIDDVLFTHEINENLVFGLQVMNYRLYLYKTDGTASGTQAVGNNYIHYDYSQPIFSKKINNTIYFYYYDNNNIMYLNKIDSNFNIYNVLSGYNLTDFEIKSGNIILFPDFIVKNTNTNMIYNFENNYNDIKKHVTFDTVAVFLNLNNQGELELWKTDYTINNSVLLKTIHTSPTAKEIESLSKNGNKAFFICRDNPGLNYQIWYYDIKTGQIAKYKDSNGNNINISTTSTFSINSYDESKLCIYKYTPYMGYEYYIISDKFNKYDYIDLTQSKYLDIHLINYQDEILFENEDAIFTYNLITQDFVKLTNKIRNDYVEFDDSKIFVNDSLFYFIAYEHNGVNGTNDRINNRYGVELFVQKYSEECSFQILNNNVCDTLNIAYFVGGLKEEYNFNFLISDNISFSNFDTLISFKSTLSQDVISIKLDSNINSNTNYYIKLQLENKSYIDSNSFIKHSGYPNLSLSIPNTFCKSDSFYQITNYSPLGGSFSGDMVYNNTIYLDSLNSGNYKVTYKYSDSLHCPSSVTSNFSLYSNPSLDIGQDSTICHYSFIQLFSPYSSSLWSSGDTTQFVIIDSTGVGIGDKVVSVIVEENNCYGYDTVVITFEDCSQSINEISQFSLDCFPNPVKETLHINFNKATNKKTTLKLYNGSNELLLTLTKEFINKDEHIEINMNKFANGVYYLKIESNDKLSFVKIIKL